ncbi:AI-2E family transporter [Frateuria aurantia]
MTQDTIRRWQLLALGLLMVWVAWLLGPVLMPFAIAAMLAYLGGPATDRLVRLGMWRTLAVSIVFTVLLLIFVIGLLVLIPLISRQVENLVDNLPRYYGWAQGTALPWLATHLHLDTHILDPDRLVDIIKSHIGSIGGVASAVLGKLSRSGMGLISWATNLVLIPVVAFYLMRDWDRMLAYIDRLLPRSIEPTIAYLARESDRVLSAFVRGQLMVMLALGLFYGAALSFVGLSVGWLIGMVAGLLSFVPYLGFIIGFGAATIAVLVQYGDTTHLLLVVGTFLVGQLLEGYVLTPKLVGDKIGLHPVAVIFAVIAGGYIGGFLGILLALPAASVILVLLRYLVERYQHSELYNDPGAEDPVLEELEALEDANDDSADGSASSTPAH